MAGKRGGQPLPDAELAHTKKMVEKVLRGGQAYTAKTKLAQAAGCSIDRVFLLFEQYPELEVMRKAGIKKYLTSKAAQNVSDIVNDTTHPNNFAASKFVLSKYKSELDEELDKNDELSIKEGAITISIGE